MQVLEIEKKLRLLYLDLKAIKEESQLVHTPYFIEHAMEHIPTAFRIEVLKVQLENKALTVPVSNNEVIAKYLAEKKEAIELCGAFILQKKGKKEQTKAKTDQEDKVSKYCHQCSVSHPLRKHVKANHA